MTNRNGDHPPGRSVNGSPPSDPRGSRPKRNSAIADQPFEQRAPWQVLGLSDVQEQWCRYRIANPTLPGTAIVRMVDAFQSKSTPAIRNLSHNFKRNPRIQARLRQLEREAVRHVEKKKRIKLSSKRVLKELTAIAFADLRQLVTVADGEVIVRDSADWPDAAASAVQSVVKTPDGLKLTFHDKLISLGRLAKILKLIPQEPAQASPGGLRVGRAIIYIPANGRELRAPGTLDTGELPDPDDIQTDPTPDPEEDPTP